MSMHRLEARIVEKSSGDNGGFVAIASTGSVDRDGEIVAPGAFRPLPDSVPVHMGHTMRPDDVVARARPFYDGDVLKVEAWFGSDNASQVARQKVTDGTLNSLSIVFVGKKLDRQGTAVVTSGELLAVDLVSIPSNRDALVLSSRSFSPTPPPIARRLEADELLARARAEVAACKAAGLVRGPVRKQIEQMIIKTLAGGSTAGRNYPSQTTLWRTHD